MKEIIRQVAAYRKNGGSNNKYTIVKCTKLIKVQNVSQDCYDIELYMRIFTQKYKKKVNFIKNNKNHKQYISYNFSFSFDTMEESIFFSYLLLENYEKKMKFEEEIRELVWKYYRYKRWRSDPFNLHNLHVFRKIFLANIFFTSFIWSMCKVSICPTFFCKKFKILTNFSRNTSKFLYIQSWHRLMTKSKCR